MNQGGTGMEVGLVPGHIVLDGDPAPLSKKGAEPPPPIFGPFLLWPNGWMHQDPTWYGGRPQPRRLCMYMYVGPMYVCMYVCMYESVYNAPLLQPKQSRVRALRPNRKYVSLACCRIMSV